MPSVLTVTPIYPSPQDPALGIFVCHRLTAMLKAISGDADVIVPTPWFPRWIPVARWQRWHDWPLRDGHAPIWVHRPRYFHPPKIGGYFEPQLMQPAITRTVHSLIQEGRGWSFIDAHFVYPAGAAALAWRRRLNLPLVITARGSDLLVYPRLLGPKRYLQETLKQADVCIAVSHDLARRMEELGARPETVYVIPNGVDGETFSPLSRATARANLGISEDRKIIISIGTRDSRKGFDLLIRSLVEPPLSRLHPELVIIGGAPPHGVDQLPLLRKLAQELGVAKSVLFVGEQSQQQLALWYNAADVFCLLSSREGCPNVVLEALACGTPVVASATGEIPLIIKDSRLGMVLAERTARAAADGLAWALGQSWDRTFIRQQGAARDWYQVAREVFQVLRKLQVVSMPEPAFDN